MTDPHEHDLGLQHDLATLHSRRRALGLLGGAGLLAALAACGDGATSAASPTSAGPTPSSAAGKIAAVTEQIPEETGGPFPADGSRGGPDVLDDAGIVREDLRRSFGDASATAEGVTLTFDLTVLEVKTGGTPLAGAAVYLWHCDRDGHYSLYEQPVLVENYLRGVGIADADGKVSFTSTFPGAYSGRWPHAHFEVYASAADATSGGSKLRTSQLALPEDACAAVYATTGYEQSVQNLAGSSLDGDQVFADGYSLQLATVSGTPSTGMTASLTIAV